MKQRRKNEFRQKRDPIPKRVREINAEWGRAGHLPVEGDRALLLNALDAVAVSLSVDVVGGMVLSLSHCCIEREEKCR